MALFTTRRLVGDVLRLVGRSFEDTAQEIQEWADKITRQVEGGIPGGFNDTTPGTIEAGAAGDAGDESSGWMSAGATIPILTGPPIGLSDSNAEGSGGALMRAGALIKRDVKVRVNGTLVGIRNALNFIDTATAEFAGVDDAGADEIEIRITASGGGGGGGGGGEVEVPIAVLQLVESHDFAAAATSHSFAGLDGDTDELYFLVYRIKRAVAAAMAVDIQPNGITTGQETRGRFDGSGGSGNFDQTALRIMENGGSGIGDIDAGTCWIEAKTGMKRTGHANWTEAVAAGGVYSISGSFAWNDTTTNITSLDIVSDQANGIDAGSYVRLYKLKKIDETETIPVTGGGGGAAAAATPLTGYENAALRTIVESYALRDILARTYR